MTRYLSRVVKGVPKTPPSGMPSVVYYRRRRNTIKLQGVPKARTTARASKGAPGTRVTTSGTVIVCEM